MSSNFKANLAKPLTIRENCFKLDYIRGSLLAMKGDGTILENKDLYTLRELFEELPCTLVALGERSQINEVTLARIRDGKATRRSTVNRMLTEMSKIYERPLSVRNVTGINVMVNKRLEKVQEETSKKVA